MGRGKLSERQESMLEARMGCFALMVGAMALPFVVGSLFFAFMGLGEIVGQARLHRHGVEVPAVVLSSEVGRVVAGDNGRGRVKWQPRVEYEYMFEGEQYVGNRFWAVNDSIDSKSAVESIVANMEPGKPVTATLDPSNPSRAMIAERWSPMPYVSMATGLGCLFLLGAGATLLLGWRWFRPAAVSVLVFTVGAMAAAGWEAWHWYAFVPESARPDWMAWVLGGLGAGTLLPLVGLIFARRGAKLYTKAGERK